MTYTLAIINPFYATRTARPNPAGWTSRTSRSTPACRGHR